MGAKRLKVAAVAKASLYPVDHSSGNSLLLTSLLPVGETAAPVVDQFCCVILGAGLEAQQSHSSRLVNDFIRV